MLKHVFLLISTAFASLVCLAQNTNSIAKIETNNFGFSQSDAEAAYKKQFYNYNSYLDGKEYIPYYASGVKTPLLNQSFGIGTLYKKHNVYHEIFLTYDLYLDKLIVSPIHKELSNYKVILNELEVDSCVIRFKNQRQIITMKKIIFSDDLINHPPNGFYEILFEGKMKLYVKHSARVVTRESLDHYHYDPKFYLLKNKQFYELKSKRKFLKLFVNHKKNIKERIWLYPKTFRKFGSGEFKSLLIFIESLTPKI